MTTDAGTLVFPAAGQHSAEATDAVDTMVEDLRWSELPAWAERACAATLEALKLRPDLFEIVVLGADDARVAALNDQFRNTARPTNVLSWPSDERSAAQPGAVPAAPEPGELGNIALAWETCHAEAARLGRDFGSHVTHLLVHATLHLLGYDHENEADAELMEATEVRILAALGVSDPYAG